MSVLSLAGAGVASAATQPTKASSAHANVVTKATVHKVAFKGSYKGTIKLLWSSSSATGTIASGKGTGTLLGASSMTGTGTGADTAYSDPFSGTGYLKSAKGALKLTILKTKSSANAPDGVQSGPQSPPATITVLGVAQVVSGTGVYKGVSGTLKFTGSFSVSNSTAATSESDGFTATLTGTLSIKK
ncbi:MAG TPA: hypothetical protein VMU98_07835 [Acidimicrobiales bacterium]|nr:hypothetical protein [Acidimicrobiales bacterium]